MKRSAVVFALVLVFAGCAPRNYVVLLDNPGGGSGKVIVSNKKGTQLLDKSGSATAIDRSNKAPSSPWELSVEKITKVFARAFGARPGKFIKYTIYFKTGETKVDPKSKVEFDAMLAEARRRPGVDATVAGHADRTDNDRFNIALSLLRAYAIRDALVKAGIPIERIEVDAYGETLPAVPTPDNVPEIHNRRVEVTIR
ncbi:MAG TPA: OmpA family protein [Candidatus Limnocylindrales bacterium]|nr:OmpA family protein [Candidatus Limnocylindrales bacterium]